MNISYFMLLIVLLLIPKKHKKENHLCLFSINEDNGIGYLNGFLKLQFKIPKHRTTKAPFFIDKVETYYFARYKAEPISKDGHHDTILISNIIFGHHSELSTTDFQEIENYSNLQEGNIIIQAPHSLIYKIKENLGGHLNKRNEMAASNLTNNKNEDETMITKNFLLYLNLANRFTEPLYKESKNFMTKVKYEFPFLSLEFSIDYYKSKKNSNKININKEKAPLVKINNVLKLDVLIDMFPNTNHESLSYQSINCIPESKVPPLKEFYVKNFKDYDVKLSDKIYIRDNGSKIKYNKELVIEGAKANENTKIKLKHNQPVVVADQDFIKKITRPGYFFEKSNRIISCKGLKQYIEDAICACKDEYETCFCMLNRQTSNTELPKPLIPITLRQIRIKKEDYGLINREHFVGVNSYLLDYKLEACKVIDKKEKENTNLQDLLMEDMSNIDEEEQAKNEKKIIEKKEEKIKFMDMSSWFKGVKPEVKSEEDEKQNTIMKNKSMKFETVLYIEVLHGKTKFKNYKNQTTKLLEKSKSK